MTKTAPHVQNVSTSRPDSSHSNVRLTRHNYSGARLLRTIRGHPEPSVTSPATTNGGYEMASAQDDDIMAPPLSSDEEEEQEDSGSSKRGKHGNTPNSMKRNAGDAADTLPPNKRAKGNNKARRASNRITLQTAPQTEPPPESSLNSDPLDWLSQSSQPRKGGTKKNKFGRSSATNYTSSQGNSFADPGELPNTPRKTRAVSFKGPASSPMSLKRTPIKKRKVIDIPSSGEKPKKSLASFKIPDESGFLLSPSTSTQPSKGIDTTDLPKLPRRARASSTSSLSSADSIASYELREDQKDQLKNGTLPHEPVPEGFARCPLCQKIIELILVPSESDPASLSLRKQQILCHSHRLKDARVEWQKNNYPDIDWTRLEKKRIPKHIPHLRQILYRKTPSFYLDDLESKLKDIKGNQSKIRRYLANELVEIVRPGYYGPKGAKVMGNTITTEMSNHLKRGLKTDETVRTVGASGYVSAVLLPELLLRIVMEDMKTQDGSKARTFINDSTEIGMLLCPDDDHVVQDDEVGEER